jgi:hypothetical protein
MAFFFLLVGPYSSGTNYLQMLSPPKQAVSEKGLGK